MSKKASDAGVPEAEGLFPTMRRRALALAGPWTAPVGSLVGVRTDQPHVVLTFDDGPEPGGTDKVLAALSEYAATATFFVLVNRALRYPKLLAEVVSAGHEIGLHGMDHRRLTRLSGPEVRRGLAEGVARLGGFVGGAVRWFRPPYGAQTPSVWRGLRGH